jgi:hypothetical protein
MERVRVPEVLFQPHIIGSATAGLGEVLERTFAQFSQKEADQLAANVFVTGQEVRVPYRVRVMPVEIRVCLIYRWFPMPCGKDVSLTRGVRTRNSACRQRFLEQQIASELRSAGCAPPTLKCASLQLQTLEATGGVVQARGPIVLISRQCPLLGIGTWSTGQTTWSSTSLQISFLSLKADGSCTFWALVHLVIRGNWCIRARACMCVCVCVCMSERKRDSGRERRGRDKRVDGIEDIHVEHERKLQTSSSLSEPVGATSGRRALWDEFRFDVEGVRARWPSR